MKHSKFEPLGSSNKFVAFVEDNEMMGMLVLILVRDDLNWLKIWRECGVLREEKNAGGENEEGMRRR